MEKVLNQHAALTTDYLTEGHPPPLFNTAVTEVEIRNRYLRMFGKPGEFRQLAPFPICRINPPPVPRSPLLAPPPICLPQPGRLLAR